MKLYEITKQLSPLQLKWLEDMKIKNWKYEDGVVNVDGIVDISHRGLIKLPVQFGYVSGNFHCDNNKLSNLEGSPREVGGDFDCMNNELVSLKGSPREVSGDFICANNQLTSLSFAPKVVGNYFGCKRNKFKSEPDHSFIKIGGAFGWK